MDALTAQRRLKEVTVALAEVESIKSEAKVYTGDLGTVLFVADKTRLKSELKLEAAKLQKAQEGHR